MTAIFPRVFGTLKFLDSKYRAIYVLGTEHSAQVMADIFELSMLEL